MFGGGRGRVLLQLRPPPTPELAMPLPDHFPPPLSRTHPWRGFHGAWAAAMARLLNAGVLPPGYYAVPFLDRDGPVEIDVATLREFDPAGAAESVQLWTPTAPGAGGRPGVADGRRRKGGGVLPGPGAAAGGPPWGGLPQEKRPGP